MNPHAIPERQIGQNKDGSPRYRRVMTPEEIVERAELNVANTAPKLAERAREERAKLNGRAS